MLTPLLLYYIFPPAVKKGGEVVKWAASALDEMGPLSRNEILMALLAVVALVLWISAAKYVNATTAAMIVISLMLLLGVITVERSAGKQSGLERLRVVRDARRAGRGAQQSRLFAVGGEASRRDR